ncbi:hypothetical protein KSS87_017456 [Heliosperma pusillum]|nr:hypothetical protein KSS87_017456 [Heliosperma pusillum]
MPRSNFGKVELIVDTGHPLLNRTVDGFLKIGTVAATRSAAEDVYSMAQKGSVSSKSIEHSLKKMCKEGAYWGEFIKLYLFTMHVDGYVLARTVTGPSNFRAKYCFSYYAGAIAGTYVGMEYGVAKIRGTYDYIYLIYAIMSYEVPGLVIYPTIHGALVSAVSSGNRDKIVVDAITGGAIATAVEFINYFT